jgi:hypothetical protein
MTEQRAYYLFKVVRRGTKEVAHTSGFSGTFNEAERHAGWLWTDKGFSSQPDRFRLTMRMEGKRQILLTIE